MNKIQGYGMTNYQTYTRNVNFRATMAEPLKTQIMAELVPNNGQKIVSRLTRRLEGIAGDTVIKSIAIDNGEAIVTMAQKGKEDLFVTQADTNSRLDVLNAIIRSKSGVTILGDEAYKSFKV